LLGKIRFAGMDRGKVPLLQGGLMTRYSLGQEGGLPKGKKATLKISIAINRGRRPSVLRSKGK